jgi:hypothetical protein
MATPVEALHVTVPKHTPEAPGGCSGHKTPRDEVAVLRTSSPVYTTSAKR